MRTIVLLVGSLSPLTAAAQSVADCDPGDTPVATLGYDAACAGVCLPNGLYVQCAPGALDAYAGWDAHLTAADTVGVDQFFFGVSTAGREFCCRMVMGPTARV